MPVTRCTINGEEGFKWGEHGKCFVGKSGRNKARNQGIAAIIGGYKFASNNISFDYDETLSTDKGKALAKLKIANGDNVYIITARQESQDNESLFNIAKELGIKRENIHFTNGKDKWETIQRLHIDTHYDNSQEQIDKINKNTSSKGILI